ncbi:MAG TPA: prohibitin family protein [Thermoanaerobaculia bacterium]|nr:prohibitin family protein [Thermoanaerobaculia bacterium]
MSNPLELEPGLGGPRPALLKALGRRLLVAMVLILAFGLTVSAVTVVPAGHVGVIDLFGSVEPLSLKSGIHLVNPFARVVKMSVMTQELKEEMDVPSKEGLTMKVESSVLFHLDPDRAPDVYRGIGPNYVDVVVVPQFRSVSRSVTAGYEAKALYTSARELLAESLAEELRKLLAPRGISIESTPFRKLVLPARLSQAIEEKLSSEQESQRMQFVLEKERQEAERKRIEAQGVADFQRIVSQGISDQLLRWKGIEATLKIAESPNTKVVVVGAGKDGLPLILGGN